MCLLVISRQVWLPRAALIMECTSAAPGLRKVQPRPRIASSLSSARDARRQPRRKAVAPKSVLKKGVLKQPRVRWEKLGIGQRMMWLARREAAKLSVASGLRNIQWNLKRLTQDRRITFQPDVTVIEFSRQLDGGDTIPGDGTIVTVGLGKPVAVKKQPLACQPRSGRPPIEERAWLTSSKRIRLLRRAMGHNRFSGAWQRHKKVTRQMCRERAASNSVPSDVCYMPTSLRDAQERGAKFAAEARQPAANAALRLPVESPRPLKSALKRRRAKSESFNPKQLASPTRNSVFRSAIAAYNPTRESIAGA